MARSNYEKFMSILRRSKRYEMDCDGILTVTDYYTGESISLDLKWMSEEIFEQLEVEPDEEEEW